MRAAQWPQSLQQLSKFPRLSPPLHSFHGSYWLRVAFFYLSVSFVTPSVQVLWHPLEVSFFTYVIVVCALVLFFHPNSGCASPELSCVFRTVICLSPLINWLPSLHCLCELLPQTHALSPGKDFSAALFIHLVSYFVTLWLLYKCFSASFSTCFLLTHFHGHQSLG